MNKTSNDVLEVNQDFYDAFAAGDYASVEKLWAGVDKVSVIHPGRAVLHGRKAVMKSWLEILENSGGSQIRCDNPKAYILGDTAYVVCTEVFPAGRLIATNIFIMEEGGWKMVHHQAGPCNPVRQGASDTNKSLH
jgi:ketosteroid isomerase-like protein